MDVIGDVFMNDVFAIIVDVFMNDVFVDTYTYVPLMGTAAVPGQYPRGYVTQRRVCPRQSDLVATIFCSDF